MQSRYYNPEIGRFINADVYASTGQGFVGNNMFAYCLNNPVAYSDSQGTDARTCLSADGAIDDTPWWDHSPSGGGVIYNYKTKDPDFSGDKFITLIALRHIGNGLEWLYDAYMRGYNLQQESQLLETQLILTITPRIVKSGVEKGFVVATEYAAVAIAQGAFQNSDGPTIAKNTALAFVGGFCLGAIKEMWSIFQETLAENNP